MKVADNSWRTFAVRAVVLGAVVFGAVRLAVARPGVAGGPARSFVTVAGTVAGLSGTQRATFHFHRSASATDAGVAPDLCAPQVDLILREGGAFSAEVPLDNVASRCPDTMFDGSDIQVDVDLPGAVGVVRNASVNPVPYAHFASVAGQYGTPDCPVGYTRDVTVSSFILCRHHVVVGHDNLDDDVVRVGAGFTAFWIDRYESTAYELVDGGLNGRFGGPSDFGALPQSGQWATSTQQTSPTRAYSVAGTLPARWITWFQAQEACRASGKRLPTGEEWQAAAQGTPDPATPELGRGVEGRCLTNVGDARPSGGRAPSIGLIGCQSVWGAQDMIGNVREWTRDWVVTGAIHVQGAVIGVGDAGVIGNIDLVPGQRAGATPWGFVDDEVIGSAGQASWRGGPEWTDGLPAAILRGGNFNDRSGAGIFAMNLQTAPRYSGADVGFRCVIPR